MSESDCQLEDLPYAKLGSSWHILGQHLDTDFLRRAPKILASVLIYCMSVSAVPIYNKQVFSGGDTQRFPYPVATAFLQLGFVALALGLSNILHRAVNKRSSEKSWLLGPHFLYKLRHAAPSGACFGLKYAITNWGLELVPTGTHLLLQATDLLWTVTFAWCINKEHIGPWDGLAVAVCFSGTVMVSVDAAEDLTTPLVPLLVNLLTPVCLALCVNFLRAGVAELSRPGNCLKGTVGPVEFTTLKLAVASMVTFVVACALENDLIELSKHTGLRASRRPSWWEALATYPSEGLVLIGLGSVFVLMFQVNLTWLAQLTSAVAVGMVGSVKIIPQWLLNAVFSLHVNLTPLNVTGATLVLLSCGLYAAAQGMVGHGERHSHMAPASSRS